MQNGCKEYDKPENSLKFKFKFCFIVNVKLINIQLICVNRVSFLKLEITVTTCAVTCFIPATRW